MGLEFGRRYKMMGGRGHGTPRTKCRFSDDIFVEIDMPSHPLNGKYHRYAKDGKYKGPFIDKRNDPYRCPDLDGQSTDVDVVDYDFPAVEERDFNV